MDKKIFVLVGPSGSGKTSLGGHLKEMGIPELVSHTTRAPRKGEVEGITYYYITKEEFKTIERIEESNYAGNLYCLSKKEVDEKLRNNDKVFIIADIHGAEQIKEQYPEETVSIFISVTFDDMIERMKKRGDSKEDIIKRVSHSIMTDEMDNKYKCDYLIKNDYFTDACIDLEKIALGKVKRLDRLYENVLA